MTMSRKSLKGSRTEKLLAQSYFAESTAYSRYTYFAQAAQKESYFQIANIFTETAANELHHAKIFLKYLVEEGADTEGVMHVDAGVLAPTVDNLKVAAQEEQTEGVEAYTQAAQVAQEEGYPDIAAHFKAIASIEEHHKERFDRLRKRVEDGTVWKREKPIKWQCLVCGYIFEGTEPPRVCPACDHPYQHYEPMEDNY